MPVTRRTVLEQLAIASDAEREETTSAEELAAVLETDRSTVEAHLNGLETCHLARTGTNGRVRVTITGEELLEIDTGEMVVVDPTTSNHKQ